MPARERRGFTVLELMVAVTLGAGILLSGRLLLDQLTESAHVMSRVDDVAELDVRQEQQLRELFRNLEVGTTDTMTFAGSEHEVRFVSWCDSANGLRARRQVLMSLDSSLIVRIGEEAPVVLATMAQPGTFRYLNDARSGGQWFRVWGAGVTVPLAVGIISGVDTTVLRIGSRG